MNNKEQSPAETAINAMRQIMTAQPQQASGPCSMGVGCDESGMCYASAHGQPEQCPKQQASGQAVAEPEWIVKLRAELMLSAMKSNFTFTRDETMELLRMWQFAAPALPEVSEAQVLAAQHIWFNDSPYENMHALMRAVLESYRATLLGEVKP